jgi:hypothetical protein
MNEKCHPVAQKVIFVVVVVVVGVLNADFYSFQVFFSKYRKDFESTLDKVLTEYASFPTMDDQDAVAERKVCCVSVFFPITETYFLIL